VKDLLKDAIALGKMKYWVFPLRPNSKLPAIADFQHRASMYESEITKLWTCPTTGKVLNYGIGISTSNFGDDEFLCVVDFDNKNGKNGFESAEKLKAEGKEFPKTYGQSTPNSGGHLFYRSKKPVRNSVDKIAVGIDIRGVGGYVVAAPTELI